jgi:DNA-directed RNA polymerase specialized sigma24 family protein
MRSLDYLKQFPFDALCEKTPAAQALARKMVTESDLLRLKVIARLHARGLPRQFSWTDLLQEAFTRVLDGSRRQPEGLPIVPFLAGVMRSIKTEYWRRARREARQLPKLLAELDFDEAHGSEPRTPLPTPERSLIAQDELATIDRLFADDGQALRVIAGLAEGRSPEEICKEHQLTKTDYDSTRKRIRSVLLREGLRWAQP